MVRMIACLAIFIAFSALLVLGYPWAKESLHPWLLFVYAVFTFAMPIGCVIGFFLLPLYCYRESQSKDLYIDSDGRTEDLQCPLTGESTDSLKQFRLPTTLVCILIAIQVEMKVITASPLRMRKIMRSTFWRWLLPGNLLLLALLPSFGMLYCLTFERGHSFIVDVKDRWNPESING